MHADQPAESQANVVYKVQSGEVKTKYSVDVANTPSEPRKSKISAKSTFI
jgi:hypothetical protein